MCSYFKYPFYDIPAISYAETSKQAFGIGEFLTITDGNFDAGSFNDAALVSILSTYQEISNNKNQVITGKTDYIICDGECEGIFDEPARTIWRNAQFEGYLHPHSSHNFNFHQNATGAYGVVTRFLESHGL